LDAAAKEKRERGKRKREKEPEKKIEPAMEVGATT